MIRSINTALLLSLITACAATDGGPASNETTGFATVTGSVTYRDRIVLTPQAVVEVQLLDVSIADAPTKQIAVQTIQPKHQVPIPFELTYDPTEIDERMTYAVRAIIRDRGRLMFTTDRSYRVLTRGYPSQVELVLVRTSQ